MWERPQLLFFPTRFLRGVSSFSDHRESRFRRSRAKKLCCQSFIFMFFFWGWNPPRPGRLLSVAPGAECAPPPLFFSFSLLQPDVSTVKKWLQITIFRFHPLSELRLDKFLCFWEVFVSPGPPAFHLLNGSLLLSNAASPSSSSSSFRSNSRRLPIFLVIIDGLLDLPAER